MRRVIALLIVIGLGVGIWLLWPHDAANGPGATGAASISTTSTVAATVQSTTTTLADTTTSTSGSHVVTTVAEAETILRNLWFGWFEGIYNQDEARIREVVILEETLETAKDSFGVSFDRAPQPSDIGFSNVEILRSDSECLAVWAEMTLSGFRSGTSDGVYVLRWTGDMWKRLRTWGHQNDLWEADCSSTLS